MADTYISGDGLRSQLLFQFGDLPLRTNDLELPVITYHGYPGAVVTSIFKPFKPIDDNIPPILATHIPNNAAHSSSPPNHAEPVPKLFLHHEDNRNS
jgi:hypothetical protein